MTDKTSVTGTEEAYYKSKLGKMAKVGVPLGASLLAVSSLGEAQVEVQAYEVGDVGTEDTSLSPEEVVGEESYVLAKDSDFKGTEDGKFRYVGDDDYVEIPSTIKEVSVTSYQGMFEGTSVKGVKSTNKNVTDISRMFYGADSKTLDISLLDTSNVTNMRSAFTYAKADTLTFAREEGTLFNTSNVENMEYMFSGTLVKTLDVSGFNTSSVVNMSSMFYNTKARSIIFGETFDTSQVTTMERMFMYSEVKELDLSVFDTSSVEKMRQMFQESLVETVDLSGFATGKVQDMSKMFKGSAVKEIDIKNFDTSSVITMNQMFTDSSGDVIDVSNLKNTNVQDMREMFKNSTASTVNIVGFGTENVKDMHEMFSESGAKELDLSSFTTGNVEDMARMFYLADASSVSFGEEFDAQNVLTMEEMFMDSRIESIDLTGFITEKVKNMNRMFYKASAKTVNVTGLDVTSALYMGEMFSSSETTEIIGLGTLSAGNAVDMNHMFYKSKVKEFDLSQFTTSKAENMQGMFAHTEAKFLDVSAFDTVNVKNMRSMFEETKFEELKGMDTWDTGNVEDMGSMFKTNYYLRKVSVYNFDTKNVKNMSSMFSSLITEILDLSGYDTTSVTNMSNMFKDGGADNFSITGLDTSNVIDMEGMFSGFSTASEVLDVTSFNTSKVTTMKDMFKYARVDNIKGLQSFDTGNVTSMSSMFESSHFKEIDISGWDTSKVTSMSSMFNSTYGEKVNVGGLSNENVETMDSMFEYSEFLEIEGLDTFNTPSVTDMSSMFSYVKARVLDASNFDTGNVTSMAYMFEYTESEIIDVEGFENDNVASMYHMFYRSKTPEIKGLETFHTPKVTDMDRMFYESHAKELDLSNFDTTNVESMDRMFYKTKAEMIDVSGFENGKVTDMEELFYSTEAKTINLEGFKTPNVETMKSMFYGLKVDKIVVSSFDTSQVVTMESMFKGVNANTVDVSGLTNNTVKSMNSLFHSAKIENLVLTDFKTGVVTDMYGMFYELETGTLDMSSFDVRNVTDMGWMFAYTGLEKLDLTSFNPVNVTDMGYMFYGSKATGLVFGDNFNTKNVSSMTYMFRDSSALELDLTSFDTANVTSMSDMFTGSSATEIDVTSFNTGKVQSMSRMFESSNVKNLDLSSFDTRNVSSMFGMFESSGIEKLDITSFDVSGVTNIRSMFEDTNMGDVYVKTTADAEKLNASENRSSYTAMYAIKAEVSYISPEKEGEPMLVEVTGTSANGMGIITSNEDLVLRDSVSENDNRLTNRYEVSDLNTYTFTLTDNYGNVIDKTVEIGNLDKVDPEITFTQSTYEWTNQDVIVTAKGIDDFSGMKQMESTWSILGWREPFTTTVSGDTISERYDENGSLAFRAEDNAGNTYSERYYVTNIDKKMPSVEVDSNSEDWLDGELEISYTATDGDSGVDYLILPNGEEVYEDTYTYTTTEEGYHTIKVADVAGNIKEKTIFVEKGKPTYTVADDSDFEYGEFNSSRNHYRYVGVDEYVEIPDTIEGKEFTSYYHLFDRTNVKGVRSNNVSVINMEGMFNFSEADKLDVSGLNTSGVTNMRNMFSYSKAKDIIGVETLDTSNVTNMSGMFVSSGINALDVGGYDTSKVTDMSNMFALFEGEYLNVSGMDTSNVTSMYSMFYGANAISIEGIEGLDTSKVTNMEEMFGLSNVKELDVSGFDTSKVTTMKSMFIKNSNLKDIYGLENFVTTSVTDMSEMFSGAVATKLNVDQWNTSNVTSMEEMFKDSVIEDVDLSAWDTSSVVNMNGMFADAKVKTQDFSKWNTSNVTDMMSMFSSSDMGDIDVSGWDTGKVTTMRKMFFNIKNSSIDVSGLNNTELTHTMEMFMDSEISSINLENFYTGNVTSMRDMFNGATIKELDTRGFDLSHSPSVSGMFEGANIENLDISTMDLAYIDYESKMFDLNVGSSENPTIYTFDKYSEEYIKNNYSSVADNTVIKDVGMEFELSEEYPNVIKVTSDSGHGIKSIESDTGELGNVVSTESRESVYEFTLEGTGEYSFTATDNHGNVEERTVYLSDSGNIYVLASDYDFSKDYSGNFEYIGSDDYVWIPETIQGVDVTSYSDMFSYKDVKGVKSTNPNVTDMSGMFKSTRADVLDLRELDTSSVTDMSDMFYHASAVEILGIKELDTSSVVTMDSMFYNVSMGKLDLSGWDTKNVEIMQDMFSRSVINSLDVSGWDTGNVTDMYGMFQYSTFSKLDLTSFDTSNVTNMGYMFSNSEATVIDVSSFDTSKVEDFLNMFAHSKVRNIDLRHFDVSSMSDMDSMFEESWANTIDLRGWNFGDVWNMSRVFYNVEAEVIDLRGWDVSNLTSLSNTFQSIKAKEIRGLEDLETSQMYSMYGLFQGAGTDALNMSGFEFGQYTYLGSMFADATTSKVYVRDKTTMIQLNNNTDMQKPENLEFVVITADLWESEEAGDVASRVVNVEGTSGHGIATIESLNGLMPLENVTKGDMSLVQSFKITENGEYDFLVTDNFGNEEVVTYEVLNLPMVEKSTEVVSYETQEVETDELYVGDSRVVQEGKEGIETVTYQVFYEDDVEVDRVEVGREVTTEPVPEIIEVGTKELLEETVYETEEIEYAVEYVDNPDLLQGETNVLQKGVNGERTHEYLEKYAGEELVSRDFVESKVSLEPVTEIIEKGTLVREVKEETATEPIPYETISKENPDLPLGEVNVIEEGIEGELEVVYEVTYHNGEEVSRKEVSSSVAKESSPRVVEVGTMVVEEVKESGTEEIAFETVYQNSSDLKVGEERVAQEGKVGEEVVSYDVVYKNGEEVSRTETGRYVSTPAVNEIILVGTKEVVTETGTEEIEYVTITRENPELPVGNKETVQEGVNGTRTLTYEVVYVEGEEVERTEVSSEVTTPAVNEIIEVGTYVEPEITTETEVATEELEYETVVKENPDLALGETNVLQKGVNGVLTIETLVTYHDGEEVSREEVSREVTTEPVDHIIEVGTQSIRVETEERSVEVPYETITKENPDLLKGETKVIQEGANGKRVDRYELTYVNGELTVEKVVGSNEVEEPTPEIIEVGTLEETVEVITDTETIPYETLEVETDDLPVGETMVSQEGVNGTKTLVYEVTYHNGVEESRMLVSSETTEEAKPKIVLVGTLEVSTRTEVEKEEVAYETVKRDNPDLPKGETRKVQDGVNGSKETEYEITYHNGKEVSREVVGVKVTDATPEIIEVGTMEVTTETVTDTQPIEYKEKQVENPNLEKGKTRVIREGVDGVKTTYYTVEYHNGEEVSRLEVRSEVTTKAQDKIVEVGTMVRETKSETETQTVGYKTKTVENPHLDEGETRIAQEGVNGLEEVTYAVTYENGDEVSRKEESRTTVTPVVNEVIEVGTMVVSEKTDTVEFVKAIPKQVMTIENPDLEVGQERVIQKGQDGKETIFRTYKLTFHNGEQVKEELLEESSEVTVEPKIEIVEIGTKEARESEEPNEGNMDKGSDKDTDSGSDKGSDNESDKDFYKDTDKSFNRDSGDSMGERVEVTTNNKGSGQEEAEESLLTDEPEEAEETVTKVESVKDSESSSVELVSPSDDSSDTDSGEEEDKEGEMPGTTIGWLWMFPPFFLLLLPFFWLWKKRKDEEEEDTEEQSGSEENTEE